MYAGPRGAVRATAGAKTGADEGLGDEGGGKKKRDGSGGGGGADSPCQMSTDGAPPCVLGEERKRWEWLLLPRASATKKRATNTAAVLAATEREGFPTTRPVT